MRDVRKRFRVLGVWQRAGERAPHKPLLVLYALGRWVQERVTSIYPSVRYGIH